MRRLVRKLRRNHGFSLIELLTSMAILSIVLSGITTVFVSGSNAQVQANRRFQAQQEARLGLERIRDEAHCADDVLPTGRVQLIALSLPQGCPGAAGGPAFSTWCTRSLGTNRWGMYRITGNVATCTGGVLVADYITRADPFEFSEGLPGELSMLQVDLPVDVLPADTQGAWALSDTLVLRNDIR